jgi:hypothetical protein
LNSPKLLEQGFFFFFFFCTLQSKDCEMPSLFFLLLLRVLLSFFYLPYWLDHPADSVPAVQDLSLSLTLSLSLSLHPTIIPISVS